MFDIKTSDFFDVSAACTRTMTPRIAEEDE